MPKADVFDANPGMEPPDIPGPEIKYKVIAEGDSWFTFGGLPFDNLLRHLEFPDVTRIHNFGTIGHEIVKDMAESITDDFELSLKTDGMNWDLILISGGGNDFFSATETSQPGDPNSLLFDADHRRRPDVAEYCNREAIRALVAKVQGGYHKIAAMRPRPDAMPMLSYTYDYCMPRNAPVVDLLGPWLYSAFTRFRIPEEDWVALSKFMLNQLGDGILALQETIPNFHVVDTRNTLTMAEPGSTADSNDWLNEVHPNSDGYEKLGAKFTDTINQLLGV